MRGSVLTASALVGGGLLAHLVLDDPGYVAISAGRSLFETTVPVFLLLLLGLYFLARTLLGSLTARRRLATLRAERRRRRARDDTQRGLLDLAAGRWRSAEDLLSRAAPESDSAAVNYLVAARAADLQDAVDRRDEWLARAQDAAPDERAAALITLAEMQMRRGQDAAAVQTLEQLDASGDLNSRGLELLGHDVLDARSVRLLDHRSHLGSEYPLRLGLVEQRNKAGHRLHQLDTALFRD